MKHKTPTPHNPQWFTMGDGSSLKYFCHKPDCVWWGWGGGAEGLGSWILRCQCEQQEGSRLDMRHWVLVWVEVCLSGPGPGPEPGLSHGTRSSSSRLFIHLRTAAKGGLPWCWLLLVALGRREKRG